MPQIISHRGLQPSNPDFPSESTLEAFDLHLKNGFSLEFDPNFTADGIVIWHDHTLTRLTKSQHTDPISKIKTEDFLKISPRLGQLLTLDTLLEQIAQHPTLNHALHLKGTFHQPRHLDSLVNTLKNHPNALSKLFAFDIPPNTAKLLKNKLPELSLSASIANTYDISRYNTSNNNTLINLEYALTHKELYDWAWLDEWDLTDTNGKRKQLYTEENFEKLRMANLKIALVTPELHGTSPQRLGGESHPDAQNTERLFKRINEILQLNPDAICTDYPEEVLALTRNTLCTKK